MHRQPYTGPARVRAHQPGVLSPGALSFGHPVQPNLEMSVPGISPPFIPVNTGEAYESYAVPLSPVDPCLGPDRGTPAGELAWAIAEALQRTQLPVRQPSHQMFTAGAVPVNAVTAADVNVTDGAFVEVVGFDMDGHSTAVIKKIGLQLESVAAFDDVTWRLLQGGQPIPGYGNITGPFTDGNILLDVTVLLGSQGPQRVSLQAISLTVGLVHLGRARLIGWEVANRQSNGGRFDPETWIGD